MAVLHVNDSNFQETIATGVTLVDFFATWCGPCKMMAPVMDKLAVRYDGTAKIAKVDVDEAGQLASQYGIMTVPTLMIFQNGELVHQNAGTQSENNLSKLIDSFLA